MSDKEIFVSVDIETDGPSPGANSMLSFGAVALDINGYVYGEFERNILTLEMAKPNERTMTEFWARFPDMYEATRKNTVHPSQAMEEFKKWHKGLREEGMPIFMGYPLGFDYKFMDWYMNRYLGENIFGISGIDIKSFAMALLKCPFKECNKRNFPREWFPQNMPHTHLAIDDARGQAYLGVNVIRLSRGLPLLTQTQIHGSP